MPNQPRGVCLISSSYPSPTSPTRGAFVEDIALGLAESTPVRVVAPRIYPDDPCREERHGLAVTRFSFGASGRLLKEYGGTPITLMIRYMIAGFLSARREALKSRVIFAHWVVPAGVIGAAVSWTTGRPLVLYGHGSDICVYAEKSPMYRILTRFALSRARHVFAASRDLEKRLVERLGVKPEAVSMVPCGVDTGTFYPSGAAPETAAPVRFLFVGDMVPAKGVQELMTAALALHEQGIGFSLDMVGDGPLRNTLSEQVERASAGSSIHLHGPLPRDEVARRMRQSDCLVLPSHNEGTPVCIMEALTCALPVVATRVGGIPDLIDDGGNGLLIPPRDVTALADALRRVAQDTDTRSRLRQGAGATGDKFSLESRRRDIGGLFERLVPEAMDPDPSGHP
ncbi:MAG: glycosyltransferase [Leptospirillia bacterium]